MSASRVEGETFYELPPLDRSGVLFGFGFGEMVVLGVVSVACFALIQAGVPFWVYAPLMIGVLVAVRRPWPGGLQLLEYQPVLVQRLHRRRTGGRWQARHRWTGVTGDLPVSLTGLELASICPTGHGEVGIVVDVSGAAATFVIELGSSSFLLEHPAEQAALLERWGRVIGASVVAGQTEVRHVSFTLISSQGSSRDHLRFMERARGQVVPTRIADEYTQLIHRGAAATTSHRLLFSVTVGRHRQTATAGWGSDDDNVTSATGTEPTARHQHYRDVARTVVSTMHNLRSLGWTEQRLLSRDELYGLVGECVDPATRLGRAAQADHSLNTVLGLAAVAEPPTAVDQQREWVTINGVAHRSFWVRTWPNYGLSADWLIRLLAEVDGERRFTVYFRPVPRTESVRHYEADMAKHDAEVLAATEKGKRVKLASRRAQQAVAELGEDLMAGYPEVEICALATISGSNRQVLRRRSDAFASLAVSTGLQVIALRDAHELGWAHSLPLGLCPLKPRTPWN